jgi:hypothetical protein
VQAAETFALATKLFPGSLNAPFNLLVLADRRTRFWARRNVPWAIGLAGYPILRKIYERDATIALNLQFDESDLKRKYSFH